MTLQWFDFYEITYQGSWMAGYYLVDRRTGLRIDRRYYKEAHARCAAKAKFRCEMKKVDAMLTSQEEIGLIKSKLE